MPQALQALFFGAALAVGAGDLSAGGDEPAVVLLELDREILDHVLSFSEGAIISLEMKPNTLLELDAVVLRRDFPEHGLKKGDAGTIVHSYRTGEGFEVEFLDGDGKTLGVITLRPEEVEPAWNAEEIRRQQLRRGLEMTPAERLRWLVEEFRVSLFAQELGTAEPVSAK